MGFCLFSSCRRVHYMALRIILILASFLEELFCWGTGLLWTIVTLGLGDIGDVRGSLYDFHCSFG